MGFDHDNNVDCGREVLPASLSPSREQISVAAFSHSQVILETYYSRDCGCVRPLSRLSFQRL